MVVSQQTAEPTRRRSSARSPAAVDQRCVRRVLLQLVGLAAAVTMLTIGSLLAPPPGVSAAPPRDVLRLAPLQVASRTATPRLRLPTGTVAPAQPTLRAARTATAAADGTPRPAGLATDPPTEVGRPVDAPADATGRAPGAAPGEPTALDVADPALPGPAGAETGPGGEADAAGGDAGTGGDTPAPGPRGLIAVPLDDAQLVERWTESGSPRADQSPATRLTDDRPGPLGVWPFYLLLGGLYVYLLVRLFAALRQL